MPTVYLDDDSNMEISARLENTTLGEPIELTDAEWAEYLKLCKQWEAWQERFRNVLYKKGVPCR